MHACLAFPGMAPHSVLLCTVLMQGLQICLATYEQSCYAQRMEGIDISACSMCEADLLFHCFHCNCRPSSTEVLCIMAGSPRMGLTILHLQKLLPECTF